MSIWSYRHLSGLNVRLFVALAIMASDAALSANSLRANEYDFVIGPTSSITASMTSTYTLVSDGGVLYSGTLTSQGTGSLASVPFGTISTLIWPTQTGAVLNTKDFQDPPSTVSFPYKVGSFSPIGSGAQFAGNGFIVQQTIRDSSVVVAMGTNGAAISTAGAVSLAGMRTTTGAASKVDAGVFGGALGIETIGFGNNQTVAPAGSAGTFAVVGTDFRVTIPISMSTPFSGQIVGPNDSGNDSDVVGSITYSGTIVATASNAIQPLHSFNNLAGGDVTALGNWTGGMGPPSSADTAYFELPFSYPIDLGPGDGNFVSIANAVVSNGIVTFNEPNGGVVVSGAATVEASGAAVMNTHLSGEIRNYGSLTLNQGFTGSITNEKAYTGTGILTLGPGVSIPAGSSVVNVYGAGDGPGEVYGNVLNYGAFTNHGIVYAPTTNHGTFFNDVSVLSTGSPVVNTGLFENEGIVWQNILNSGTFRNDSSTMGEFRNQSGGLLYGNGTVEQLVLESGSTLSPGHSPGTMFAGSAVWAGGANFLFEINDATGTAGSDPGWDLLDVSGSLTITASAGNEFTLDVDSLLLTNSPGDAANFNQANNYSWTFASAAGGIVGFSPLAFLLDLSGFTNLYTGVFSVAQAGNSLNLVYTPTGVVPEPGTLVIWSVLGLGLLGARAWRVRRTTRAA